MEPKRIAAQLQRCTLFSQLSNQEIRSLLDTYYFPVSNYHKGKYLYFRGDRYEELAIVLNGTLRAEMGDPSGHVLTVEFLPACQLVASSVLFSRENHLPVDLVAETDVKLTRISKRQIFQLCSRDDRIFHALLEDMGSRTLFLSEKLFMTKFLNLEHKMAVYLCEQMNKNHSQEFRISKTKQQLADVFGVARTSVNRICSQLEDEGVISFSGKDFVILKPEVIQRMRSEGGLE